MTRELGCRIGSLLLTGLVCLPSSAADANSGLARRAPAESFARAEVSYETVSAVDGTRLRMIVTRPARGSRHPLIFFVGWLSCDSVAAPNGSRAPLAQLVHRLVDSFDAVTVRLDKRGVGDSEGSCAATDFATELSDYRQAFDSALALAEVDRDRVFVFGVSNGAAFAPLVVSKARPRGYIAASGWSGSWLAHMVDSERQRLSLAGEPREKTDARLRAFATFYAAYLDENKSPRSIVAAHPEWADVWSEPDLEHQYGRPVAYYQQLERLHPDATWNDVKAEILFIHGEYDVVMAGNDVRDLAATLSAARGCCVAFAEVPRMTHDLGESESMRQASHGVTAGLSSEAYRLISGWLDKQGVARVAR